MRFSTNSASREDCYLQKILTEYLFCCGDDNLIKCGRFNENYTLITNFDLDFPGKNNKYFTLL